MEVSIERQVNTGTLGTELEVSIERQVNTGTLGTELAALGGAWKVRGVGRSGKPGYVRSEDTNATEAEVRAVIDAHDPERRPPTPPDPPELTDALAVLADFEGKNPGVLDALKTARRYGR